MDRRSFVGSVIGFFVTSGLPFKAAPAKVLPVTDKWGLIGEALLALSKERYEDFSVAIYDSKDQPVMCPPLTVKRHKGDTGWSFVMEGIKVKMGIVVTGQALLYKKQPFRGISKYQHQMYLAPGDTLNANQSLTVS